MVMLFPGPCMSGLCSYEMECVGVLMSESPVHFCDVMRVCNYVIVADKLRSTYIHVYIRYA